MYQKNISGDIEQILDINGQVVVQYAYDAWGNCSIVKDTTNGLGTLNPFRYRGYYFDNETGWYYLKSRYYNPQVGRFLNADSLAYLDGGTVGGLNLYAYCLNNPVSYVDPEGTFVQFIIKIIKIFIKLAKKKAAKKALFANKSSIFSFGKGATLKGAKSALGPKLKGQVGAYRIKFTGTTNIGKSTTVQYIGKGNVDRAFQSAKKLATDHSLNMSRLKFQSMGNNTAAFIQEARWMNKAARKGVKLLNKNLSPGFKKGGIKEPKKWNIVNQKGWMKPWF